MSRLSATATSVIPGGQPWLYILGGFVLLALLPWAPPAKPVPAAIVNLDNCNGCSRCFDDCPFGALTMVPRTDGRAYDLEPIVDLGTCTSCGICAGSCPTSTPFRRAGPIRPGIELPHHTIATLRDEVVADGDVSEGGPRILVFGCETSNVAELRQA